MKRAIRHLAPMFLALAAACEGGGGDLARDDDGGRPDGAAPDAAPAVDADPGDAYAADAFEGDATLPDAAPMDGAVDARAPDGTADAAVGPPPRLAAAMACAAPEADPCALPAADPAPAASYRKDFYFPDARYPEYTDPPVDGGRVQVAAVAAASGPVTAVTIDGIPVDVAEQPPPEGERPPFEWWHVWPQVAVAGEPLWVSFHSRDPRWDDGEPAEVEVETTDGVAVSGRFAVHTAPAPLTYVTTADDGATLLVHVRNDDDVPHTLARLVVNGRDATGVACVPTRTLAPGAAALWTVPQCAPLIAGQAWTVVAEWADAPPSVGAGRVLPERFPVEAWNTTTDCPFPGGDAMSFARHVDAGIDTFYLHEGTCAQCGCDLPTLMAAVAATEGYRALVTWGAVIPGDRPPFDATALAGIATGDESDGELYDDAGVPHAARKAQQSRQAWARFPQVPTFSGGRTNGHVGTFAGTADVQGMNLFVAACAPHVTEPGHHPPPRAAFDYLRNTRDNHRPLPTWLYAQGLAPAWNRRHRGLTLHWQPDPQEIAVQAYSVLAAGGKGLMWFQTNQTEAALAPDRWAALAAASRTIGALRDLLREGDPTGGASADADTIVEAIRARDALVLVAIDVAAESGPDDVSCLQAEADGAESPHWHFAARSPEVRVHIPEDLAVADAFEVVDGDVRDLSLPHVVEGRTVTFPGLPLDDDRPARVFVFAADPSLRERLVSPR